MKTRLRSILFLCVMSVVGAYPAMADNTLTLTFTKNGGNLRLQIQGKVCIGTEVVVKNNTGGSIDVVVKDGDGSTIIDETVPDGGTSSAGTLNNVGTGQVCGDDGSRASTCYDFNVSENCFIIPTLSEWGVIAMVMLLMTSGTLVFGRRRRPVAVRSAA